MYQAHDVQFIADRAKEVMNIIYEKTGVREILTPQL
jgi:hypothetical protein